jgi:hypothetical protein
MGTNGDETERVRDLSHGRRDNRTLPNGHSRSDYATSETSSVVIKATIHCTVVLVAFSSTVLVVGRSDTLSTVWRVFVGSVSVVWGSFGHGQAPSGLSKNQLSGTRSGFVLAVSYSQWLRVAGSFTFYGSVANEIVAFHRVVTVS